MERTKLTIARAKKHWTLEKAAEAIGVGVTTLHQWEKGRAMPYPVNKQRLCEVYGATAAELDLEDAIETSKEVVGKSAEELGFMKDMLGSKPPLFAAGMTVDISGSEEYWQQTPDGTVILGGCRTAAEGNDVNIRVEKPTVVVQNALEQVFPQLARLHVS